MTGFFAQHQADLLPMDKTGWQIVKEANEILMDDRELQEIMKKFRFRGDRMHVKVASLSGGEKARLAIVRMMLIPSRMLIFDEPTNHLDVPMKAAPV
ncbi:ABCF5 [Symbiodinium microadriaticum]|nr:ABCF5 [Symbiodinium microadriaticum]